MIDLTIFLFKYSFLALIYLFLFWLLLLVAKDLRNIKNKTLDKQAWLIVKDSSGTNRQRSVVIKNAVTIGRDERNILVLDDESVSAFHARVFPDDSVYFLEDLGSTNGTLVDGRMAVGKVPLRSGGIIQIGRNRLIFQEK